MPRRIGLLGGTFDPPHNGHVSVARDVQRSLGLDCVLLVPSHVPPHKRADGVTRASLRLEMVTAAVADAPGLDASGIELEREGPSYTVDTLRQMHEERPGAELAFIVGADQLAEMAGWREPEQIAALASLVVMNRGGLEPVTPDWDLALEWTGVSVTPCDVSSTEIRRMVAEGISVEHLIPRGVVRIIEREKLYYNG